MRRVRTGSLCVVAALTPRGLRVADQDSVQMLTRNSQVGEFYVMQPPQVEPDTKPLHTSDMLIYDEESDRHVRITWGEALAASCVKELTSDPNLAEPSNGGLQNDKTPEGTAVKVSQWYLEALKIQAYNEDVGFDPSSKTFGPVDSTFKKVTYGELDRDIRIVVARPFIEHQMHNVILTVSGRDTGATLFGPADMQLSANTQVKTIEGAHHSDPLRWGSAHTARTHAPLRAQATTRATSRPWSPSRRMSWSCATSRALATRRAATPRSSRRKQQTGNTHSWRPRII